MSKEDFEGIAQLAKENHKNRVEKNPDRIQYAIEQFEKNGIEYYLKTNRQGISIATESAMISCFNSMQERARLWAIKMQGAYTH